MATSFERFRLIGLAAEDRRLKFSHDVAAGLTASPKRLSCCYFYDREGSALFEAICELPEYYLTRAEASILTNHADEIVGETAAGTILIELGSGNAAKTRLVIEALLRRQSSLRYVPIDICRTVLEESSQELLRAYPALEVLAVAGEYREGLGHLQSEKSRPKLVLWLGSNIGNLERDEAARFLAQIRETLSDDDRVLVGIDLRKERMVLEAAYNDRQGVTAAFNRNLLERINRELGGSFDPAAFDHQACYDESRGRIEMYLISSRPQEVAIEQLNLTVPFAAGEAVHTENSYKYSRGEIAVLAAAAGLHLNRQWLDYQGRFSVNLLAPAG